MYFCLILFIMDNKESWFSSWFDTPYYHILYNNRDESEAELFIRNLKHELDLSNEEVLDLACGKGRHAKYLSELGLSVLGVDLSPQSIAYASKFSTKGLEFQVHDMRNIIENRTFDIVFNLFTSFGYFETDTENIQTLESISEMLRPKGKVVIDFMNSERIISTLVEKELKSVQGIDFQISRSYDGTFIRKDINFLDNGQSFSFQECVRAFKLEDFQRMLTATGFKIGSVFGDFDLSKFDAVSSNRLILIASKNG